MTETNKRLRAAVEVLAPPRPKALTDFLSPNFETLVYDKGCRQPIGWGWKLTKKLKTEDGTDLMVAARPVVEALKEVGDIEFLHTSDDEGNNEYGLIVRWLTAAEAEAKYGPRGAIEWGPKGGFKQVTYGASAFNHAKMKPEGAAPPKKVEPVVTKVSVANERPVTRAGRTFNPKEELVLDAEEVRAFDSVTIEGRKLLVREGVVLLVTGSSADLGAGLRSKP